MSTRRTSDRDPALAIAFGLALRERRLSIGSSQEKLAYDAGIHPTYVSDLERGHKLPSLTIVFALAEALEMLPQALVAEVAHRFDTGS